MSEISPCTYRVSIKAIIINEKGELLLGKRGNDVWSLPGGGYELDDVDILSCITREIHEETGLLVTGVNDAPLHIERHSIEKGEKMNIIYRVEVDNFDTLTPSDEFPELHFVSSEDIRNDSDIFRFHPELREKIYPYLGNTNVL